MDAPPVLGHLLQIRHKQEYHRLAELTFTDSLLRTDSVTILCCMQGEINLRDRLLVSHGALNRFLHGESRVQMKVGDVLGGVLQWRRTLAAE